MNLAQVEVSKFCRYSAKDVLTNQVLAFFDRNRDEELTAEDVAIKFNRRLPKVRETLKAMVERGLIDRYGVRAFRSQLTYVYRRVS